MMGNKILLNYLESQYLKSKLIYLDVGDKIRIRTKISEGDKVRIQLYEGMIIAQKNSGVNKTITVRKIFHGIGVERCFLLNSPKIKSIKILKSSKTRRSKLYYLRNLTGKSVSLKESFKEDKMSLD
jgi:large subunit ribosomal protein L19